LSKIVILGLGNILFRDEGIGVHVINALDNKKLPSGVEIIDGGTASLDILSSLRDITKLIIVDAVKLNKAPATIYRFTPKDLTEHLSSRALSLHQISALDALSIAKKLNSLPPDIIIIGIEPKDMSLGLEISDTLKMKIPDIVNIVTKEINTLEKVRG